MRGTARRRPIVAATAGILLASGLGLTLPSAAQADTTTATGSTGSLLPASWRFDNTVTRLDQARAAIGSNLVARAGYTGKGVGVALVDTGVVPVPGLASSDVKLGPDLSAESQEPAFRYLDTFGHGTHMAGIIVGRDSSGFQGVAPDAQLTSVKVGVRNGAADVSQVIAAIDWVVQHRKDDPDRPIRVLNLSYGTDGHQDYTSDPLTHAVENAWRAGIVVVAAAGNRGVNGALSDPAFDPYVITVGAADLNGTVPALDDTVTAFSSRGSDARRVDLVAPGKSIASLRDPGSYVDAANPDAVVDNGQLFKGSGTSQAAAFVSGAVAQLLQQRPGLTPDQVKALLKRSATPLPLADPAGRGSGELNVLAASLLPTPGAGAKQTWDPSQGTGSIEGARGNYHLSRNGDTLQGEFDVFGRPWPGAAWATKSSEHQAWVGGKWMGAQWTGDDWRTGSGAPWDSTVWDSTVWDSTVWDSTVWDSTVWDSTVWDSTVWDSTVWDSTVWDGNWS